MSPWIVDRDQRVYTSCYCEENIWKLCEHCKECDPNRLQSLYAVFISNEVQQIPIWEQRSATNSQRLVLWDYHVILLDKSSSPAMIYDFDSTLSFPIRASDYIEKAIRDETNMLQHFRRMFRVIPAQEYLDTFASDRSHMLEEDGVTYKSVPPSYPPIFNQKSTNNIHDFIDMKSKDVPGNIMKLNDFREFIEL